MPETTTLLIALVLAATVGVIAVIMILARREREDRAHEEDERYAPSTEGVSRCPHCGRGNLVGSVTCVGCGQPLE